MKRLSILPIIFLLTCQFSYALDLDMTVDDDIRKNYNSSKLQKDTHTEDAEEVLPALPDIVKTQTAVSSSQQTEAPKQTFTNFNTTPQYSPASKGNVKIHAGTTFDVVNSTKINDWLQKGNSVKFAVKSPIVKKKYTIPAGTVFTGEIIETHQPQITCNGGLVVIRVKSMAYKGQYIPVNAYVVKADSKKVFLNNIKGDRTYLKTTYKKGNWGRTIFNKMMTLTVNLGGEGSTLILSPFPFAYGTICLGLNTLTSPICAFFSKGGHVSIPAGSKFKLRLMDPVYID